MQRLLSLGIILSWWDLEPPYLSLTNTSLWGSQSSRSYRKKNHFWEGNEAPLCEEPSTGLVTPQGPMQKGLTRVDHTAVAHATGLFFLSPNVRCRLRIMDFCKTTSTWGQRVLVLGLALWPWGCLAIFQAPAHQGSISNSPLSPSLITNVQKPPNTPERDGPS